jgi:N-acyl-D-aspartate/D-glutamate deacylase
MFDLVIRNGRIVDGSGAPARMGNVAIRDGKIAAVGEVDGPAKQTLDAGGRVVSPGFIDVHTHYDAQAFWDPTLSPSCYHGVTTIYGGFCGFSIAPLSPEAAPYLLRMLARVEGMPVAALEQGVPWDWRSFAEFLGKLEGHMGLNAGFMAGHSAIRCVTMGEERARTAEATPKELAAMKKLLAQSLEQGAMGFSSTIAISHNDDEGKPVPSRMASREEIVELAGVCRAYEGTTLEFLPGVGAFPESTIELMVDMSVAAQRPLNWNLLAAGDNELVRHQLAAADLARKHGGDIIALTPVETATVRLNLHSGFIFDAMGGWEHVFRLPIDERIAFLKDPANRAELKRRAETETLGELRRFTNWDRFLVDGTFTSETKPYEGRTLAEIAKERGQSAFDALIDIAIMDRLRTSYMHVTPDADAGLWKQRGELWSDDRTVIGGSDAGAHLDMIDSFAISTQTLARGVREYGVISLEEAVRQLTSVPARLFGLKQRGLLQPGFHADIVVFDPDKVGRGKTYMRRDLPGDETRIYADALGVDHVYVNGVEIVHKGVHTGALPGKILRSGVDTATALMPVHAGAKTLGAAPA